MASSLCSSNLAVDVDCFSLAAPAREKKRRCVPSEMNKKSSRSAASLESQPAGPQTLAEVLNITMPMARVIVETMRASSPTAKNLHGQTWQRLVLTTSFSGVDFPGAVLFWLRDQLQQQGMDFHLQYYAATDHAQAPRLAVMAKQSEKRPLHFFDSIYDRISQDALHKLQAGAENLRRQVRLETHQRSMNEGPSAKELRAFTKNLKQIYMMQFVQYATRILEQIDMSQHEMAWCTTCQAFCNARPVPEPHTFYLEVAGSVCKPYSTMNAEAWGLLDPNALPMLVWAFWCKRCNFNAILHECVVHFPLDVANQILTAAVTGVRRSVAYGPAAAIYNNPYDLGVPKQRPRQFARWLGHVRSAEPDSQQPPKPELAQAMGDVGEDELTSGSSKQLSCNLGITFDESCVARLFYRKTVVDASVYMIADERMVQAYYRARAVQRKLQLSSAESEGLQELSVEDVIPICARVHLAAYKDCSLQTQFQSNPLDTLPGIVCLMQSPNHIKPAQGRFAPPLLTGSLPYSLRWNRLLTPDELMLLAGLPVSQLLEDAPVECPWSQPLSNVVSEHALRVLLGNGMDVSQIGAAIAMILLEALSL